MDPSHARKCTKPEIEATTSTILKETYPDGITIPIDIDRLAEGNDRVDDIVPIPDLEETFGVAAVLSLKSNGCVDILVDQDTLDFRRARASFSIAHELAHVVLHYQVFEGCRTVQDSVDLNKRIRRAYSSIERAANHFAGAVLIPRRQILGDTARIYEFLVKTGGYNTRLDRNQISATLAQRYKVNVEPMSIRLDELGVFKKIQTCLLYKSPFLDL